MWQFGHHRDAAMKLNLDLQVRGRQCSDRGEYTQPYGRVTQAAWAARGGCVAELLPLVSTKTVLLQWRCYGRHHLSTWILPLIMINNHDDVIFREREMEKILPFTCWFFFKSLAYYIQTLKLQWNAGMMSIWLSTDSHQVCFWWESCMGSGKMRETPNHDMPFNNWTLIPIIYLFTYR